MPIGKHFHQRSSPWDIFNPHWDTYFFLDFFLGKILSSNFCAASRCQITCVVNAYGIRYRIVESENESISQSELYCKMEYTLTLGLTLSGHKVKGK